MMIWSFLFAHFLVDFIIQTKATMENKQVIASTLIHSAWIFFVTLFVAAIFGFWNWEILFPVLIITVSHGIIDYFKAKMEERVDDKWKWLLFTCDQVLHATVILFTIIQFFPNLKTGYLTQFSNFISKVDIPKFLVFLIIITFGGSHFISKICQPFITNKKRDSLMLSGMYIGILERIIISASILIGRFEIIGFLIAAKLIRHQDKENIAEYFLIGTFTSFIWAALFTFLYLKL